uniref:PAS domain-containing protein n=1 Tax=Syphacia muris TaxID=451379 RepID=A0A0N5AXC3_9BILA
LVKFIVNRFRNLDRRRETSRHAARDRRGKEADIFTDLKEVVPIVEEATVTHVDRIALLRVASTLCRLRKNAASFLKTNLRDESGHLFSESTLLESLDGFLAIIDSDDVILYVSESISIYLGLTQTDLTGRSLKEFVHQSDYEDLLKFSSNDGVMMTIRMKSVISPRGRNLNLKSALFKPVVCRVRCISVEGGGRVRLLQGSAQPAGQGSSAAATAKTAEVPNGTYMTRHTCDMKFSYVSESFTHILRQESRSLIGTSFYSLVHPADITAVASSVQEMLSKGHARTPYYRLIGVNDTVVWVQTEATTVNHTSKGHKAQYIICVHDFLGDFYIKICYSSQSEEESFTLPTSNQCLAQVKKELDDNAEVMKNSCDEVLQWLFRDQKAGGSDTTFFRTQDITQSKRFAVFIKRSIISDSDDMDPPLAKAAFISNRFDTPESSIDDITYEIGSNSPYANNAGIEYSPLAAGFAECELRSTGGSSSSGGGTESLSSERGSFDSGGGTTTAGIQAFGTELSSDPLLSNVRVSNVSSDDAFTLSNANEFETSTPTNRTDMYTILPSTCSSYTRHVNYEPYIQNSSVTNAPSQINVLSAATYKEDADDFYENPDNLQLFAPYVSHEDATQLTSDIQGLANDFFTDLIPSDPAPLSSASPVQQVCCLGSNSVPLSTDVIQKPCTPYPTPNTSPTVKRSTQFCFSKPSCHVQQQPQQQCKMSQSGDVSNSCSWADVEIIDPVITFHHHRDVPTIQQHQQQRV